jgi:hypothetical protein
MKIRKPSNFHHGWPGRWTGELVLETAPGMEHPVLVGRGPYDLIIANILAGPLVELPDADPGQAPPLWRRSRAPAEPGAWRGAGVWELATRVNRLVECALLVCQLVAVVKLRKLRSLHNIAGALRVT